MRFGVVVFPGSNCDHDMLHVLGDVLHADVMELWHKDTDLHGLGTEDCIILPGGFSYGDYLRAGAIARFSPIMKSVIEFANAGGYVFGICNGFQILCESHLLPGALVRNRDQRFVSKTTTIKTCTANSPVTHGIPVGKVLSMPVAHAEGRFLIDDKGLNELVQNDQILFRYCDPQGNITEEANFNGSTQAIAGICNRNRNVIGMMPHPERASEAVIGGTDGKLLFDSLIGAASVAPVT